MNLLNMLSFILLRLFGLGVLETAGELFFARDGEPVNTTVLQGDEARFNCRVGGALTQNTRYAIHWKFNDNYLYPERQHRVIYSISENTRIPGDILTVKRSDTTNQGFYCCEVYVNGYFKMQSRRGYLKVIRRPSFQSLPSNKTVVEGQTLTLHCRLQNFDHGSFSVTWLRNYVQLSSNYEIVNSDLSESLGVVSILGHVGSGQYDLMIRNVSRGSTGRYFCRLAILMKHYLTSKPAWVSVLFPPDHLYPECIPSTLDDYYSEGDLLHTLCRTRGGNAPVYFEWSKNGIETYKTSRPSSSVAATWTLTERDNGTYIVCSMYGPAILRDRECAIGPIRIHYDPEPRSYETSSEARITVKGDVLPGSAGSSKAEMYISLSTVITEKHSVATIRPNATYILSTSMPFTTSKLPDLVPNENSTSETHLVYALTISVCLILAVVAIVMVYVRSRKMCVRRKVPKSTTRSLNLSEPRCSYTDHGDTVHYDVVQGIVTSDLHSISAETANKESLWNSATGEHLACENDSVCTADVTYASVCKGERNKIKLDDYDKLSFSYVDGGSCDQGSKEGDKKSRNVQELVYADLDLHRGINIAWASDSTLTRQEPSVIYAELQSPKK